MPTTPHQHWYDQTTENGYPLADDATLVDDAGQVFPAGLILDANVRFPSSLGDYAFFSAVTNGPGLCTVIISVATTLDGLGVPIAAATMRKKADRRLVKLTPLAEGVGGWVVFGPITASSQVLSFRFSNESQSRLVPRAARSYDKLPVVSLKSRQAATALEGIVSMIGQNPVSVRKEVREIDGVDRQCVIVSLTANQGDEFASADAPVLQEFLGPCDKRPESGTCGDPQPIETISQVLPDCNGQITIEFKGCAQVSPFSDNHGFVLNCSLPRAAVCPSPHIPDEDGNLPNEYNPIVITGTTSSTTGSTQPPDGDVPGTIDPLPFTECFRDGATDRFATLQGQFNFVDGHDPNDTPYCSGESDSNLLLQAADYDMNIAAWVGTDMKTVSRLTLANLRLSNDLGLVNGGLVINYRFQSGRPRYFYISIDYYQQSLRLQYYNGFTLVQVDTSPMTVYLNRWYSLAVTTVDHGNSGVSFSVVANDIEFGGDPGNLDSIPLLYFRPSDGINGIGAYGSAPFFSFFRHEEA